MYNYENNLTYSVSFKYDGDRLKDVLEFVANYLNIGIMIIFNVSSSQVPS